MTWRHGRALPEMHFRFASNYFPEDRMARKQDVILDTRDQNEFNKGFIPNSIFIGLDNFSSSAT